jgi:type IV secretory pathway VirB10-like protein
VTDPANPPSAAAVQMRLRAQPRPVLRLSRKVLIGGGAVSAVGLAAVMLLAIAPPAAKTAAPDNQDTAPKHTPVSTEALNGLPKDYAGVPKLGPPLPGDFGRPILAAGSASPVDPSVAGTAASPTQPTAPNQAASQQVEQAQQARIAAHSSQIFFQQASPGPDAGATLPTPQAPASLLGALAATTTGPETKADPDRKQAFLNQASDTQIASDARLAEPASPYLLLTGSVVPAALITGIRSDIPGQVLAQVTQDVRDSVTGQYLLIPKGARLIGQYDNAIAYGQSRILLVWTRLILPNGKSLVLNKLSAADAGGYAGLQDKTDYHWGAILNAAAVSTLLGIGAQSGDPESDSALVRAIRDGAGDSINRAGQQIVERQLNVQPTITIRPGLPVRVILSRDLVLEPYGD